MRDGKAGFARDWERLAGHVRKERSELVLLPEIPFHSWFAGSPKFDRNVWDEAVAAHRRWMERLPELAPAAVIGSRPIDRRGRRLIEGFVWTEKAGARGVHLKGYLPDEEGYYEASWYQRGDRKFSAFGAAGARVGMMICSDLWSMWNARAYGRKGVEIIAVPFAASKPGMERWLAGGKVAAVISGAFCVASNRAGGRAGSRFGGTGWIIAPDARILGLTSREEPFVTADIDLREARAAKKTYPRDALRPD